MHDPSDATKDEENHTTTLTDTNDAKEAMKDEEERKNDTLATGTGSTEATSLAETGTSSSSDLTATMADAKPETVKMTTTINKTNMTAKHQPDRRRMEKDRVNRRTIVPKLRNKSTTSSSRQHPRMELPLLLLLVPLFLHLLLS
jgi:hypothetical protein